MISNLKPYPAYKDSGVPWLGKVPSTWNIARNGGLFTQRNETGFAHLPILEVSLKTGVQVRNLDGSGRKQVMSDRDKYKRARKGDLAYNMMRMWQGAIGMAPTDGLVSPAYVVARPLQGVESRFFLNLFRTDAYMGEVDKFSHGIVKDRNRLYWEDFKQMPSPVPPLDEQSAIIRFLGYADRRIKHYIRAKQKLIRLLEEQKQGIISRAVTRGLPSTSSGQATPNVRLKPSGVEWLGDVPEHWEVKRLKWVTRLQRGYDLPAEQRIPGPFPVVSSGGIIGTHSESQSNGPGVVIGRYGSTDAVFFIESDFWPHNTALFVTDFQGNRPRWCYFMLRTISKADHSGKSAVPGVDRKDLYEIKVAVPPVDEQDAIVSEIENASEWLDRAVAGAQRKISLLREYHTRLIADVVTGKLDVREAAAKLPDETDEVDTLDDAETPLEGEEDTESVNLDSAPEEAEA